MLNGDTASGTSPALRRAARPALPEDALQFSPAGRNLCPARVLRMAVGPPPLPAQSRCRPFTPTFCGPPLGPRRARMERGAGPGAGGASPRDSGGPPPAPAPRPRQVLPGVSGDFPDFLTFLRFQRSCGV